MPRRGGYGRLMIEPSSPPPRHPVRRPAGRLAGFVVLLGVVAASPPGLGAQHERAYEILESAQERYEALATLCARFHQQVEVTLLAETRTGRGRLCLRRSTEFSMRFSDPEGDLVVVDGQFLWTYSPSMDPRQVMRFAAVGAEGRFNFYKNLLENPRRRFLAAYEGMDEVGGQHAHKLLLTPKKEAGFRRAIVWIDGERHLIVGVDVHDVNESIRRVRLTDIGVDIDVPDEEFRFVPPPGARVMSR